MEADPGVWVADRGFASAANRRYLQRAGGHYILGEKLRGHAKEARAALARQGRYHPFAGNLRVKEAVIDASSDALAQAWPGSQACWRC